MTQFITSPFDALLSIKDAALSSDSSLVATDAQQWVGVAFELGEKHYIADMNQVGEVLTKPDLTTIPGVKSWVLGVSNIRGRLVPVVDLAAFFRLDHEVDARRQRIITVEVGDSYIGLLVDQVFGMRHFNSLDFEDGVVQVADNPVELFVSGSYSDNQNKWAVVDLFKLLFSDAFQGVAA